jgi:hypothetical protein
LIVPLADLKIARSGPQPWRVQFVRQVAARGDYYVWSYSGIMSDAPSGQWPAFVDSRFFATTTGVALTVSQRRAFGRADVFGLLSGGGDRPVRPYGIGVGYPVTPTINFVGTANPDFSNIEHRERLRLLFARHRTVRLGRRKYVLGSSLRLPARASRRQFHILERRRQYSDVAAGATVDRLIVKYVFHAGADTGT